MRFKNWDIAGFEREVAKEFFKKGINPLVSVFLASRGVSDILDARAMMGDIPSEIHDPFLLTDMDKAVARINTAVDNGEKIVIYGDYDVDGMTSCVMLALWLRAKNASYEIYIPGRFSEGYGLNTIALDALKARGVGLVITVDCGITDIAEAEHARSIGLDLVITDHHECRDTLPVATAVIDPKRPDCGYPHKLLAGVGVAFKLVCALDGLIDTEEVFRKYGDLVSIGTVADVMPVGGENCELIRRGLRVINDNPRPGLLRLLRESNPERSKVTSATLGFIVCPRLNAAGRMGQTDLSVNLLMTDDDAEAEMLTAELNRLNMERRALEIAIYDEAASMLPKTGVDGPIVLARRGWHQGVTGIVAARMAENHLVPAIIISIDEDGRGRGSSRSYGTFGIYGALTSCKDILDNFGGHEMAAGLTIAEGKIDEFRARIREYYFANVDKNYIPGLRLDFEVEKPELLTILNIEALERLEPFGNGNPPPCLCIKDALLAAVYSIGAGKHSRLRIEKSGRSLDCVYFSMPSGDLEVSEGMLVDIAFEPQINEFRGRTSVQLLVIDIKMSL
ncbi:MAG: single-stranded-DNA-specific exonuclease RecJ [Oscillospiraceae bacterium]|nr:single-stranded-DNA-specific exonuclease RecJ [Oscillospiraceae bacterium]